MGQGLPKRIISRRAIGTGDPSCDLSTGSGRRIGRFVSAPVPLPSLSQVLSNSTGRALSSAFGGDVRSHQLTFVRVPPVRQARGILF